MGMFDFNPADVDSSQGYGDTNAFMLGAYSGAGGMMQSIGKLAGFQDEDDLLKEIHENADYSTMEGRKAAVAKIMAINPTKGKELSEQLNQVAQAEAATSQLELANENALLTRAVDTFGPELELKFQNDATIHGERAAIHMWLTKNKIPFDADALTTTAEAASAIDAHIGTNSSKWKNDMYNYVQARQASYVKREAYKIAGITLEAETGASVSVDATMADLDTPTPSDTQNYYEGSENYNANASQWESLWKKIGGTVELVDRLDKVNRKLFQFLQFETFLPKDKKDFEDAEDAVSRWIVDGGAIDWFKARNPLEVKEFEANPVKYYKKHIKKIEANFTGGFFGSADNTDLFASIPY